MTLEELTKLMQDHTRTCAPGSECPAWQNYVSDCWKVMDCTPGSWSFAAVDVPPAFAAHWTEVANGPDCN